MHSLSHCFQLWCLLLDILRIVCLIVPSFSWYYAEMSIVYYMYISNTGICEYRYTCGYKYILKILVIVLIYKLVQNSIFVPIYISKLIFINFTSKVLQKKKKTNLYSKIFEKFNFPCLRSWNLKPAPSKIICHIRPCN